MGFLLYLCRLYLEVSIVKQEEKPIIEIKNRRARYEYTFIQEFEAGIMLTGTEIKSVRKGQVNLTDAFCVFKRDELYIRNLYIAEYELGTAFNHDPRRVRKLLLKKSELSKLDKKVKERGYTIVPVRMYINARGLAKIEIALAQGKKSYDKRSTLKDRELSRDMDRIKKLM
jgi:SsrA-binding protein